VASKAGAAQFVRQAAIELAKFNILVNAIAPGPVITNIGGGRLKFEAACPMHDVASPDDLKGAAIYLASPASRLVTGRRSWSTAASRWERPTSPACRSGMVSSTKAASGSFS
jgi:NAD(P)-dependent dehydrogenase (short-subunit alcohol dehydrogenase family)